MYNYIITHYKLESWKLIKAKITVENIKIQSGISLQRQI